MDIFLGLIDCIAAVFFGAKYYRSMAKLSWLLAVSDTGDGTTNTEAVA
jgi:hypothetical protein